MLIYFAKVCARRKHQRKEVVNLDCQCIFWTVGKVWEGQSVPSRDIEKRRKWVPDFLPFFCQWASPNLFVLCKLQFTQVCNKQLGRDDEHHNFEIYRLAVELLDDPDAEVCISRGCKRMWPIRLCAPFSSPLVRCWQPQLREIPVPWCRILQVMS